MKQGDEQQNLMVARWPWVLWALDEAGQAGKRIGLSVQVRRHSDHQAKVFIYYCTSFQLARLDLFSWQYYNATF